MTRITILITITLLLFLPISLYAQDSPQLTLLGRAFNFWDSARDVIVSGDHAFVACGISGVQVLDISGEEEIELIGYYDIGIGSAVRLLLDGETLFVGNESGEIFILDVSEPANPSLITKIDNLTREITGMTVNDDILYVTAGGSGVFTYDISDIEEPDSLCQYNTDGYASNIQVKNDGYAYVADSGVLILDVSDPENIEYVENYRSYVRCRDLDVAGDYAYALFSERGLNVLDISDYDNVHTVGVLFDLGNPRRISLNDDLAYISSAWSGIKIAELNVDDPQLIGEYDTEIAHNISVSGDFVFVADGSNGLLKLDVSDPDDIEEINHFNQTGFIQSVFTTNNTAYMAQNLDGLYALNISDLGDVEEIGFLELDDPRDVFVRGELAFVTDYDDGLLLIDISDPEGMEIIESIDAHRPTDILVKDNYAFVWGRSLRIIDFSDLGEIESFTIDNLGGSLRGVFYDGHYAYLVVYNEGLVIFDLSDIRNIRQMGRFNIPRNSGRVFVQGNIAYVVNRDDGLYVIDVRNKLNPHLLGRLFLDEDHTSIIVSGSYAIVSYESNGIAVVDISDPENPELISEYKTSGYIRDMMLEGSRLTVAAQTHFDIYNFPVPLLHGYVTDLATGDPLEGALISIEPYDDPHPIITDADGHWAMPWVFHDVEYDIRVSLNGYNPAAVFGMSVAFDETLEVNFELTYPEIELSLDGIVTEVEMGDTAQINFTIANDGNGSLEWSAEKRLLPDYELPLFELRESFNASDVVEDERLQGVCYFDDNYYLTGRNLWGGENGPNMIYALNREGRLVDSYQQPDADNRRGMADLACDAGNGIIWGAVGTVVYGLTTDGEEIVSWDCEIVRTSLQALTWDDERELLWLATVTSDIYGYTADGQIQDTISRGDFRNYGFAWWQDDPDGYPFYILSEYTDEPLKLFKVDPETDDYMEVDGYVPRDLTDTGGIFINNQLDRYSVALIQRADSDDDDRIDVGQLHKNCDWFDVDPASGILQTDSIQEINLTFFAGDVLPELYEGRLRFLHNAAAGELWLPLSMDVIMGVADSKFKIPPSAFAITSITPNPSNSTFRVHYSVAHPGEVSFTLFDLSGRMVERAHLGAQQPGYHTFSYDLINQPSGVYLIRLETDGKTSMKKLVLLK